jgi:hypothetical protein
MDEPKLASDVATEVVELLDEAKRYRSRTSSRRLRRRSRQIILLEAILDAIENLNVMPDNGPAYTIFLRRMQRFKILRDQYYPNWQQDWG